MSKLLYTTAISLLTSSAMAMTQAQDIVDPAISSTQVTAVLPNSDVTEPAKAQLASHYATLFQPYMVSSFFSYLPEEKAEFRKIVERFNADLQNVNPKRRHRLTQKLNVFAMFESGLAEQSTNEVLSELYARVKSGQISSALATVAALEKWDIDDTREDNVALCIQALDGGAVKSYEWVEDDLKDYLEHRLDNPDSAVRLNYSEELIVEYCEKIAKNECTLEQATHVITHAWLKDDVLDNAIADCLERLNEAKISESEKTVTSLLDFAWSNQSGRSSTYEWSQESNDKYITEAIEMLWQIKDQYGELPGVAKILLGDLWLIVKREDHDQNVIGLLDNKHPIYTENDVALLLEGIDGDSPLDVISIKNIETYCTQDDPIVLYAALLKPYMQYRVLEHSKESEDDLAEIMNFIGRSYQSLDSDERQEITAKLNIMAIFESGLAREYADTTVYGEFIQQLSDEIENNERSAQDATDALVRQLDYDNTLNGEVKRCVRILAEEGYQSYVWEDDEDDVSGSDNATASSLDSEGDEETDYSDAEEVAL